MCQLVGVDDEHAVTLYPDITAPSIKSWIEAELDRNGDGRWEGEVDYVRTAFGTSGAPALDPGCDVAKDPDCDLIYDKNDNCPLDYNPDQENTDDPNDPWDRTSASEPGDVCDLCPGVAPNGGNCNDDAERLAFGLRPRINETHVVSTTCEITRSSCSRRGCGIWPATGCRCRCGSA
ncbi:MAG: hypothetical protein KF718_28840 [Polyangiaceae bacterium]|nr:hypothetical protein [Polyangiaceae bacterium]